MNEQLIATEAPQGDVRRAARLARDAALFLVVAATLVVASVLYTTLISFPAPVRPL